MRRILTVFAIALALAGSTQAQQDLRRADSRVAKRAVQVLDALNDGGKERLRQLVAADFAKSMFTTRSAEQWVDALAGVAQQVGKLTSPQVVEEKTDRIIVKLGMKAGEIGMRVSIEAQEPYGISGIVVAPLAALKPTPHRVYDNWTNAQDLLEQVRADFKVPAMALAVYQNGNLVDQAVSGVRAAGSKDPVQLQDRWLIGSNTKSMTSTLIAVLIEQGKLRWDTTLSEALPEVKMNPGFKGVTLEQVMHHRGGIPQDQTMNALDILRIVGKLKDAREIRAAYVRDMLGREPVAKPGEKVLYSNAGYVLLGAIAERTMGRLYEELMQDLVFKPLGMDSAVVGASGRPGQPGSPGQPQGHKQKGDGFTVSNLTGIPTALLAPAGIGVSCTVADLAKYVNFHWRGMMGADGLLKHETVQRLHAAEPAKPGELRYACGWVKNDNAINGAYDWHNGSDGTFFADMAIWPADGLVVVAITNTGWAGMDPPTMQAILAVKRKYAHR